MRCKQRPFCGVIYTIKERCFLTGVVPQCICSVILDDTCPVYVADEVLFTCKELVLYPYSCDVVPDDQLAFLPQITD
jgi:hypothetical protein